VVAASYLLLPLLALAQFTTGGESGELNDFGAQLLSFINDVLVPLIFAVALVLFIWGIYLFLIYSGGDGESRKTGRSYMLWGILAFVIMVSVWGITNLVASGLGFSDRQGIDGFIPEANNAGQ